MQNNIAREVRKMLELMNKSTKANVLIFGIWAMGLLFALSAFISAMTNFISILH
ncbi:hypothetical protein M3703_04975 [Mannheimia haemolytica]|uniref:hypothetical protein n=1 Tax=Mannheimia haemolytica TaxID=75985 RepID=UPI00201BFE5E|nr:hypothetical protein [Mannheimia haemolytica]UQX80675.1 hypothetical protein M3703_04975 [Mannheimia haemolytica]